MKLGDDCDDIDLDISLNKYALAKDFLFRVLDRFVEEAGLKSHADVLAEGAVDRLVLASGGVARDFLTIFRRAIEVARERGGGPRGPRIGAEDINVAAGEHDSAKREELKRDTLEERVKLERAFSIVREFCLGRGVNCMLIERDKDSAGSKVIGELVDLRLLHVVSTRISLRDGGGTHYAAYMLDVSQYTGDRKIKDVEMIPFWKSDGKDALRRGSLVFDPDEHFKDLHL
jgi:hypothetical protein